MKFKVKEPFKENVYNLMRKWDIIFWEKMKKEMSLNLPDQLRISKISYFSKD